VSREKLQARDSKVARVAPWAIFCVLGALTTVVWHQQIQSQRELRRRHTQDVCVQASRRLEVFVESRLTIATIFAHRWATHEERDYSRQRFEESATLIVDEIPGYHAMGLVPMERDRVWLVPRDAPSVLAELGPMHNRLMDQARRENRAVLSEPIAARSGTQRLIAVRTLTRGAAPLGFLLVEFDIDRLMESLFHERIRSEFNFRIEEDDRDLYIYAPEGSDELFETAGRTASRSFSLANRRWRMTVVPRSQGPDFGGWSSNLAVPLLGFLLSLGIAGLVYALERRIDRHRVAREEVLVELVARKQAEDALRGAEARYHSVFDAATDGLLVMDEDGRIVEANSAACEMRGYEPGQLEGKSLRDLISPEHRPKLDVFVGQLGRRGAVRLDSVAMTNGGASIDVEVRGTSFRHGDRQRVLAIISDVSERKRAQERHAVLSRKALMAQEDERARVSRELHDELGQLLTAVRFELGLLQTRPAFSSDDATSLRNAIDIVEKAAEELRRICKGLRPPLLDDLGIGPAAELLLNEFEERTGIEIQLDLQLADEGLTIPAETSLAVYRILQEALNNVGRHAGAKRVAVSLLHEIAELRLSVYDDGKGFEMSQLSASAGSGIVGMQERAHLVRATLEVRSVPDEGTRVELSVPVPLRTKELS